MATTETHGEHTPATIPCCPDLNTDPVCDVIDFRRRLRFPTRVRSRQGAVVVEVIIHTRYSRCSGPLALGDLVYSTTLLPGERVRLATSDRRSRFSFDSTSNLSYRSEQLSEEQYHMTAMHHFMADASTRDQGNVSTASKGGWDFHGDAEGSLGFFSVSAETNARGSYNSQAVSDWLVEHSSHASSSDRRAVEATRKAHSLSIGEVSTREHKEGESQEHFESSSREFRNPNKCHAVTYLFYRINKMQVIKFEIVAIERRVLDPAVQTAPVPVPPAIRPVGTIAEVLPATSIARLAKTEGLALQPAASAAQVTALRQEAAGVLTLESELAPLEQALRTRALAEVDQALVKEGLLDAKTREVSAEAKLRFSFERTTSLPTAGVIVKGCLDVCDTCEPTLDREIELDLERKRLENELLKKRIELLDKSQEYRCCPPAAAGAIAVAPIAAPTP